MRILAFVAKTTGLACLKWLLAHHPEDEYTIFVGDPDKALIADFLNKNGVKWHDLATCDPAAITAGQEYDWLINIWSAYIFREDLLGRVTRSVNMHPSYLPYGRGRDPIVWAIRDQVPAGATLHQITAGVDEGPIWAQVEIPFTLPVRGEDLYNRVEPAAIELFCSSWTDLRLTTEEPRPQGQPELPTRKRKDLLADRLVTLQDDAETALSKILAHDFSANGYTALLENGDEPLPVSLALTQSVIN